MVWGVFAAKRYSPNVIRVSTKGPRAFSKEGFVFDKAFFYSGLETLGLSLCPNFLSVVFVWVDVTPKEISVGLINFFADVVGQEGALHDICVMRMQNVIFFSLNV